MKPKTRKIIFIFALILLYILVMLFALLSFKKLKVNKESKDISPNEIISKSEVENTEIIENKDEDVVKISRNETIVNENKIENKSEIEELNKLLLKLEKEKSLDKYKNLTLSQKIELSKLRENKSKEGKTKIFVQDNLRVQFKELLSEKSIFFTGEKFSTNFSKFKEIYRDNNRYDLEIEDFNLLEVNPYKDKSINFSISTQNKDTFDVESNNVNSLLIDSSGKIEAKFDSKFMISTNIRNSKTDLLKIKSPIGVDINIGKDEDKIIFDSKDISFVEFYYLEALGGETKINIETESNKIVFDFSDFDFKVYEEILDEEGNRELEELT